MPVASPSIDTINNECVGKRERKKDTRQAEMLEWMKPANLK